MEIEERLDTIMASTPSELEHYGVIGMKWGVRRSEKQLAKARAKREKKTATKDFKKKRKEYIRVESDEYERSLEKADTRGKSVDMVYEEVYEEVLSKPNVVSASKEVRAAKEHMDRVKKKPLAAYKREIEAEKTQATKNAVDAYVRMLQAQAKESK